MSTRERNFAKITANATPAARLPQPIKPRTGDRALDNWIEAMHAWRLIREGELGNPFEKTLTGRDLVGMGVATVQQITNPSTPARRDKPGVVVSTGTGTEVIGYDEFAKSIQGTKLYTDLVRRIDDPARFDALHERTRAALLEELAPMDGQVRASIRRVEEAIQSDRESFAQDITTLRSSVARAAAGVRQVRFTSANENRATAGQVTTITARLDNFDGGGATVEESMTAIADRATGLEAKYTVKVTAGGAVAGFGLAATSNTAGASSAFIIQADKFAIVDSSYSGGLDTTPDASSIMFGVDGTGAYFKGDIRGGGNLDITGNALIRGTTTATVGGVSRTAAMVVNSDPSGVSSPSVGVWGFTAKNSGTAVRGDAIAGTGAAGVYGTAIGTSAGSGVAGIASGAGNYGVYASSSFSAVALYVSGPMQITDTTQVNNLNANYLQGNTAAAFATAGHNHDGAYLGAGQTAVNSDALGGYTYGNWLRQTGVTAGSPGTAFTHTAYIVTGGITIRVPCFYP